VARVVDDVDAVIHLAALIPPRADHHPARAWAVNVGGTGNLLRALDLSRRRVRLIHTSSISVYGDRRSDPWIKVSDPLRPSPHDYYAETKIKGEELVRTSRTDWTVFRLTGVMSHRIGLDPLMFHMPLETPFEMITARDCAYALVQALDVLETHGQIYNLAGGPRCRSTFREYLDRHLSVMGLGEHFLPDDAFAEGNFHCAYYQDSDEPERLLGFQRDGLDEWFEQVRGHTHPLIPMLARASRPLARQLLLALSEPLRARRSRDHELAQRFCIEL
jgi:nucleoside-diphosphate-sugar epimerase